MTYCRECGAQLKESSRYCPECGSENALYPKDPAVENAPSAQQQGPQQDTQELIVPPVVPPPLQQPSADSDRPAAHAFAVLSTWSYVWSFVLLGLPLVGLVTAIVWACGGAHSQNRRHMGRAYLILFACGALLSLGIGIGFLMQLYSSGLLYPWMY